MVIRGARQAAKSGNSGYALGAFGLPYEAKAKPAFDALCQAVGVEIGPFTRSRGKALRAKDRATRDLTFASLIAAVVREALLAVPSLEGVRIAFGSTRYTGGPISYDYLIEARELLSRAGLITYKTGWLDRAARRSSVTTIKPTPKLLKMAQEARLRAVDLRIPLTEPLVLRKAEWIDPPASVGESGQVILKLNEINRGVNLTLPADSRARVVERLSSGYWIDDRIGKRRKLYGGWDESLIDLRRIYTRSWDQGGRLYGGFWINMPHEERPYLLINGEPTVERDFRTLHPRLLYAMEGVTGELNFDPYRVPSFDQVSRDVGKRTFARLLNSDFRSAMGTQAYRQLYPLHFTKDEHAHFESRDEFREYVIAMRLNLSTIDHNLGKGYGVKLQNLDSDIAMDVCNAFVNRGLPIFPVHDSFIVREQDSKYLVKCMDSSLSSMFLNISREY